MNFATCVNIMHGELKERESLVWNHAHLWPTRLQAAMVGQELSIENGHGWAWFHTRLSLPFNLL